MVALLLDQQSLLVVHHQNELFKHLTTLKNQSLSDHSRSVVSRCPSHLRWAVECCQEKGASSWLSALPLNQYGFSLNKGEFVDALCLCYGFAPPNLPSHCVCGKDFSMSHAFSLSEVCHDAQVEPHLQPLFGEVLHHRSAVVEDDARVDIRASGFWRCSHLKIFFDACVFNCFAATNCSLALAATFCRHEGE